MFTDDDIKMLKTGQIGSIKFGYDLGMDQYINVAKGHLRMIEGKLKKIQNQPNGPDAARVISERLKTLWKAIGRL